MLIVFITTVNYIVNDINFLVPLSIRYIELLNCDLISRFEMRKRNFDGGYALVRKKKKRKKTTYRNSESSIDKHIISDFDGKLVSEYASMLKRVAFLVK